MPFKNEHSIRLKAPKGYKKYRRGNLTTGVDAIYGIKDGKSEIQALRFDKSKFSPEEARAWATKHKFGGSLHPAKDHDESGPAPAGSAGITVTTALKDVSTQYSEQNELDDDYGDDLIDMLISDDFDPKELEMGIEHETEHTSDKATALKIAFDHLEEHPDYYSKLKEAEKHMDHASSVVHKEFEDETKDIDGDDEIEFEAFKSGKHVSSEGEECEYTDADLEHMCEEYNARATIDPAPLTLGHPTDNSPAYGWIKSARTFAGKLLVKAHQLNKDFVDAVKQGAYKKVSLSLYDDDKGKRIRHCGFLGAMPPAIKGLQPVSFASSDKYKSYTEEFAMADKIVDTADLNKKLAWYEKLFNMFKLEVNKDYAEEKVIDHSDDKSIQAKEQGGAMEDPGKKSNAETKTDGEEKETKDPGEATSASAEEKEVKAKVANEANAAQKENEELKLKITSLESQVATLQAALAKNYSESKKLDAKLFCEDLVKNGQLRPADVEMTVLNIEARQNLDEVRNYSEEQSSAKKYIEQLAKMPKIIEFGEFPQVPNMTSPASIPDVGMAEYLEKAIKDKLAATPNISYFDAMKDCYAEAQKKDPVKFAEFMSSMIPSRG